MAADGSDGRQAVRQRIAGETAAGEESRNVTVLQESVQTDQCSTVFLFSTFEY